MHEGQAKREKKRWKHTHATRGDAYIFLVLKEKMGETHTLRTSCFFFLLTRTRDFPLLFEKFIEEKYAQST